MQHIECPRCGTWRPFLDDYRNYLCDKCRSKYLAEYRRRKQAGEVVGTKERRERALKRDLAGKKNIVGLFSGCTAEQKHILLNGTVEDLLKLEVRR